ncbi:MAG: hypothetical protein ABH846_02645 [Patescibacteria group bacterium]
MKIAFGIFLFGVIVMSLITSGSALIVYKRVQAQPQATEQSIAQIFLNK